MLDVVAGKDCDRPLGRKVEAEERRPDPADAIERLGIGELAPRAVPVSLGKIDPVRRGRREVNEAVGKPVRIADKLAALAHDHAAVGTRLGLDLRSPEAHFAQGRRIDLAETCRCHALHGARPPSSVISARFSGLRALPTTPAAAERS